MNCAKARRGGWLSSSPHPRWLPGVLASGVPSPSCGVRGGPPLPGEGLGAAGSILAPSGGSQLDLASVTEVWGSAGVEPRHPELPALGVQAAPWPAPAEDGKLPVAGFQREPRPPDRAVGLQVRGWFQDQNPLSRKNGTQVQLSQALK